MNIVDLTRNAVSEWGKLSIQPEIVALGQEQNRYSATVWHIDGDSMLGSYLDLPGHIRETDDGRRGDNLNPELFFRIPTTVIHLNITAGPVTAQHLFSANNQQNKSLPFLAINAIGDANPHDIPWRSVFLDDSAVNWIINSGCRLLISDVFESEELSGVFLKLFRAGIQTLCEPVNLAKVTGSHALVTILFPKLPIAQLPVRILAEVDP